MKIYTKQGDKGSTQLASGEFVSKDHRIIEGVGALDETNSFIGLLRNSMDTPLLKTIQNHLFILGSNLSAGKSIIDFPETNITLLETSIDLIEEKITKLENFILPSGSLISSLCHIIRSVIRRSERFLIKSSLSEIEKIYINRLSDYFFMLARQYSDDELWINE
jgi:cob(I)alamin adenosyltransferase